MRGLRTYVINLDGSDDRLASIGRHLHDFGIGFERVPAFDGRPLDLSTVEDYDAVGAQRYMGRGLVGGEIGCYRSHLDAARRFLQSDADYALILEDDARPLCDPIKLLTDVLPDLDALDPDWMMINIGNDRLRISTTLGEYTASEKKFELVAAHYFPMTTSAIVWSRKGAERFIDGHNKIFSPVDNFFRYWLTREGHGYSFWPPVVATIGAASQIMATSGQERKQNRRQWYYPFSKWRRLLEDKLIAWRRQYEFRRRKV